MSKPTLYKVRNKYHEIVATKTKQQLLRSIAKGRFTGDEEIAPPPYLKWHRFSAHPIFFDAFIRRIHAGNYHSPDGEPSVAPAAPIPKTNPPSQSESKPAQQDPDGTRNLDDVRDFGATVHQSDIDELFRDDDDLDPLGLPKEEPVYEEDPVPQGATDLIQIDDDIGGFTEHTLPAAPEFTENRELPPEPQALTPRNAKPNRRVVLYGGVAVLLALLLMGGEDENIPKKGTAESKAGVSAVRELISSSSNKESQLEALIEEGELLAANDTKLFFLGARRVFQEAESLGGGDAAIYGWIAELTAMTMEPGEASKKSAVQGYIQRGRALDPHFSAYYRAEAILLLKEGNFSSAREKIYDALETDPGNPRNLATLGEIQYAMGELAGAAQSFTDALKVDPEFLRARYFMAVVALELGNFERAKQEGLEALRINPLHPRAYLVLGKVSAAGNQIEEAVSLLETAGRLARFTSKKVAGQAYFELGKLHELSGSTSAAASYRLAYHYDPSQDGLSLKVGGLDLEESSLRQLASDEAFDSQYFMTQGAQLEKERKLTEAQRIYQAAALLDRRSTAPLVKLGEITEKTADSYDDYKRVMNQYQRAIERNPTNAEGYIKLGLLETEQYNLDRALVLLRQAESIDPNNPEVAVALGKHFFKRRDYNAALQLFLQASKLKPEDSEILYYAGKLRLLFANEGSQDATKFFSQAYSIDPTNYDALVEWLRLKVKGYEKNFAIKFVRNLMAAEPNNAHFYWALGEVYSANKEFRRAISYYHKSLDLDNRNSKFRMSLAQALEAVGDLPKATAEYRLASLLDRRNSDGFYRAADLLFKMKDYDSAEKVIKFLIGVTPNYPGAHRYLSKVYQERRKKDLALKEMEIEVKNNPENYKFVLELAQLYMEYGENKKAVEQLKKVTNLPSLSKAAWFVYDKIRGYLLLSRAYRALNRPESAEAAITLALEIDPSDPELHRELGYVYYALQRDKEGVKAFEFYLKRKPAAQDTKTIKKLIDKMRIDK